MRHGEKVAPVMAAVTSLATIACCLPVGFVGAAVMVSLSMAVAAYQPWFLGASVLFLLRRRSATASGAEGLRKTLVFIAHHLQ